MKKILFILPVYIFLFCLPQPAALGFLPAEYSAASPEVVREGNYMIVNGNYYSRITPDEQGWSAHYSVNGKNFYDRDLKDNIIDIDGTTYYKIKPGDENNKPVKPAVDFLDRPRFTKFNKNHIYEPDLCELSTHERLNAEGDYPIKSPYMAVYSNNGKVLIYVAAAHGHEGTIKFTDYAFRKFNPEVVLLEVANTAQPSSFPEKCFGLEPSYAAALASERAVPIVFSDLNDADILRILRPVFPDVDRTYQTLEMVVSAKIFGLISGRFVTAEEETESYKIKVKDAGLPVMETSEAKQWFFDNYAIDFDTTDLKTFFPNIHWGYYYSSNGILERYEMNRDYYARDPFMLKNIAAALNKYDVVLAIFGAAHHRNAKKVLTKMTGDYDPDIYDYWNFTDASDDDWYWYNYENACKGKTLKAEILAYPRLEGYGAN